MNFDEKITTIVASNDEFKSCDEIQQPMSTLKRDKEFESCETYHFEKQRRSQSSSQPPSSRKRFGNYYQEIFTTYESGLSTIGDIGPPIFISTSCSQVNLQSSDNVSNYFSLKDPKTNYILQKAHYFSSNSDAINNEVKVNPCIEGLTKNGYEINERLPCLQILSHNFTEATLRFGQEIDQKIVENKYYTDDGNICVSPNVVNCNPQNCFPYETKFDYDFASDIRL
uniref:Uncharacterized protein n=1 Tax=Panagrolaimus sp. PS1159 TaxID=55785 RepID=A0AC35FCX3_9BILA